MRRTVLALLVLCWLPAVAQAGGVILGSEHDGDAKEALEASRATAPEFSFADVDSPDAAEQLKHAEVILAIGPRALTMARAAAPDRPTVYAMVPALEAAPSKSVTGVALEVPALPQFASWKQLRFDGLRVGVIYDPKASAGSLADAQKAAAALGLTLVTRAASDAAGVKKALAELAPQIDALWLVPDRRLFADAVAREVVAFTLGKKIALLAFSDELTAAGALASLAPDGRDIGRRAARIAVGIAGRAPEQRLPVPPPATSPGALTVNTTTAQRLGIDVPEPLLQKARKVYH